MSARFSRRLAKRCAKTPVGRLAIGPSVRAAGGCWSAMGSYGITLSAETSVQLPVGVLRPSFGPGPAGAVFKRREALVASLFVQLADRAEDVAGVKLAGASVPSARQEDLAGERAGLPGAGDARCPRCRPAQGAASRIPVSGNPLKP